MNIVTYSVPAFVILLVVEIIYDRFKKRNYLRLNDTISNISAGILQQSLKFAPLFIGFIVYQHIFNNFAIFESTLSSVQWWNWALLFVLVDFIYYWFHRLSHRVAIMWSGHVVHHQSEEYNLSVAMRQGVLQGYFSLLFNIPLAILGYPIEMVLLVSALNSIYQFWIHTRYIKKLPFWFEAIFNTPSHHRVHHGRNPNYIDKNYAGMFIVWDKLFGTFEPEDEKDSVVYGVTTPIQSWNPLQAQFSTLFSTLRLVWTTRGFLNRFKILFKPPGWSPEAGIPGLELIHREKFDPVLNRQQVAWAILLFMVSLSLGFTLIVARKSFSFDMQALIVLLHIAGLFVVGRILDAPVPIQQRQRKTSPKNRY